MSTQNVTTTTLCTTDLLTHPYTDNTSNTINEFWCKYKKCMFISKLSNAYNYSQWCSELNLLYSYTSNIILTLFLGSLYNIKGWKEITTEEQWYCVLECKMCYLVFICVVHRCSRSSSSCSVLIVHLSTPPPVPQSSSPLLCFLVSWNLNKCNHQFQSQF